MNIGDMDIFGGLVQELCLVYSQQVSAHPDYMSSHRIGYLEKKWESVLAIFGVTDEISLQMFILFNCLFLLTRKQSARNLLHQGCEKWDITNDKENDNNY